MQWHTENLCPMLSSMTTLVQPLMDVENTQENLCFRNINMVTILLVYL